MDIWVNIALVGFGNFGKKYFITLQRLNLFKKIFIFKKNKKKGFKILSKYNLKKLKINLAIIATPPNTHFKIASLFLREKIPFILEKPVSNKLSDIKKLIALSQKNNINFLINYSDLYNQNFIQIKNIINLYGGIEFINIKFEKYNDNYKNKNFLPCFDWFPHFFAIFFCFFQKYDEIIIEEYKTYKVNQSYFQSLKIKILLKKKVISKLSFNNFSKKPIRQAKFKSSRLLGVYDGYSNFNNYIRLDKNKLKLQKASYKPMDKIIFDLSKLYNNKEYITDLSSSIKIHKAINSIKLSMRLF